MIHVVEAMLSLSGQQISENISIGTKYRTPLEKYDFKGQEVVEDFKNYKDAMSNTIKYNLKLVDELPPLRVLSASEIKRYMTKRIQENLEEDELFEKSVAIKKYMDNISKYVSNYFKEVFEHNDMTKNRLKSELFDTWRVYYNSDLPIDYILSLEKAVLLQINYLSILERVLRKERIDLLMNRNNRKKFEILCKVHNNWVDQFKAIETLEDLRIKFFWYIDFCNCEKVEETLKVKRIKTAFVNLEEMDNFVKAIDSLANKVTLLLEKNTVFQGVPPYEDDGVRTISKIIEALRITEG